MITVAEGKVVKKMPGAGIEPAQEKLPRDFKSLASTSSATRAFNKTNSLARFEKISIALNARKVPSFKKTVPFCGIYVNNVKR